MNAGPTQEAPRSPRQLLADRVFGPFFFANSFSNIGNWFQNVAAGIVVFELTGSNQAVGAVSILQFAFTLLLTPAMGALTDRVDRRKMLLTGQAIAATGAGGLAVAVVAIGVDDLPGPWPIYAATAVIGFGAAVILPSLQAIVPAFVPARDLDEAITLNSLTFNIARAIGPVAAGATVSTLGAAWAFAINFATFLPLLVVLAVIRPRHSVEPSEDAGGTVREGFAWVRERRTVLVLLATTLAVGWTSDPFSTLMPALAEDLGGGETLVGVLVGAFGGGAAVMAPLSGRVRAAVGRGAIMGLGLGTTSMGLVVLAVSPGVAVAIAGSLLAGAGFLLGVTSTNTELQRGIPDDVRGRVMALWSVAFLGCRPVAALVDGTVADAASPRIAIGLAAAIAAVAGLGVGIVRPTGDDLDPDEADPGPATDSSAATSS